jgi:hypothetical protein
MIQPSAHTSRRSLQWGRDLTVADRGGSGSSRRRDFVLQWGRDLTVADRACTLAALGSTLRRPDTSGMESKLIFEASIEHPPYRKRLAYGSASATWGLDAASLLAALSRHENRVLTQFSLQGLGK